MNLKWQLCQPKLIPRVKCWSCGWSNNKPSKKREKKTNCSKCGKNLDKKEFFIKEMKKRVDIKEEE